MHCFGYMLLGLFGLPLLSQGQPKQPQFIPETRQYAIEVAGVRVGTLTATRTPRANREVLYTQMSEVKVNFLVYKLTVYYKTTNLFRRDQLVLATVDAHTNKGDFTTRTEWKGDHYEMLANQYKYTRRATQTTPIDYTLSNLYFSEPTGHSTVYSEYFGDYFTLTEGVRPPAGTRSAAKHTYRAQREGRQDEYIYENGQLVKIIKINPIKNFVVRLTSPLTPSPSRGEGPG